MHPSGLFRNEIIDKLKLHVNFRESMRQIVTSSIRTAANGFAIFIFLLDGLYL